MGHRSMTRLMAFRFPSHRKRNLTLGSTSRPWGFTRPQHNMERCTVGIAASNTDSPTKQVLTPGQSRTRFVLMGIETIGEALSLGWRVVARCVRGREDGPTSRSSRECTYRRELDLETLVCTRGRTFPLTRLESRLRCPRCGNRRMAVMFESPKSAARVR